LGILGNLRTAKSFYLQFKYMNNYKDIFRCYMNHEPLPTLELRSGLKLKSNSQDDAWTLFREIFIDECYTHRNFYRPNPGDVIIDCGANIGYFSHYMASQSKDITVYALEPSQKTFSRLIDNIQTNQMEKVIKPIPFGLFNKEATLTLNIAKMAGSSSSYVSSDQIEEIRCKTLPQLMKELNLAKIDLLKMDVEGAELEIFEGIDDDTFSKISHITLEYHEENRPGCQKILTDKLKQHFKFVESWPISKNNELGILRASK